MHSLYYTALPEGTDPSSSSKAAPTVPANRAKAVLAVLPPGGVTGIPRATVATADLPDGWSFNKRSQKFDRNEKFEVAFVNPLDVMVPAEKLVLVTFALAKDAITLSLPAANR